MPLRRDDLPALVGIIAVIQTRSLLIRLRPFGITVQTETAVLVAPYLDVPAPNIRVITLKDFRKFSKEVGFHILKEVAINTDSYDKQGSIIKVLPDLRATYGIFMVGKSGF